LILALTLIGSVVHTVYSNELLALLLVLSFVIGTDCRLPITIHVNQWAGANKRMHKSYYDNGPYLPKSPTLLWHDDLPILIKEHWDTRSERKRQGISDLGSLQGIMKVDR
jgi:hypothetical protein